MTIWLVVSNMSYFQPQTTWMADQILWIESGNQRSVCLKMWDGGHVPQMGILNIENKK